MNAYGFAAGDPVNFTDPFGLCTLGKDCWAAFKAWLHSDDGHRWERFKQGLHDAARMVNPAMLEGAGAVGAGAAASTEVGVGTKVYRVFGGESKEMGKFWTTENPSSVPGFAAKAGLPAGNTATSVAEGVITDARGIVVTKAAPGAQGPGGITEVQVPNAATQVKVTAVKPYEP